MSDTKSDPPTRSLPGPLFYAFAGLGALLIVTVVQTVSLVALSKRVESLEHLAFEASNQTVATSSASDDDVDPRERVRQRLAIYVQDKKLEPEVELLLSASLEQAMQSAGDPGPTTDAQHRRQWFLLVNNGFQQAATELLGEDQAREARRALGGRQGSR